MIIFSVFSSGRLKVWKSVDVTIRYFCTILNILLFEGCSRQVVEMLLKF